MGPIRSTRGGGQAPEAGPLACIPCGHLSSRLPPPAVFASALPLPALVSPPSRASFSAQGLLPCPACPPFSPSALPRTGTMHGSCGAGFRLGLRAPASCPPCLLHVTLAGARCVRPCVPCPLCGPVLHFCPLAAVVPFPAAPAAASWRRVCSLCLGKGRRQGGGGRLLCSPFHRGMHVAGTMRAPGVALGCRGGACALSLALSLLAAPLVAVPPGRWCSVGGALLIGSLRHTLVPRVPAARGKHNARTMQAQTLHSNRNVFRLQE